MGIISVIAAAAAAWIFGAVWYGVIGRRWMEAQGLTEESLNRSDPVPYIGSFICCILVAGMTRHILAMSGIDTLGAAAVTGLGLGLFVAAPWIATNVLFSVRSKALIWMDGAYPAVGMTLMGIVLALFG
ncbi:DUF1761 domain-containing protein [Psychromarinibacter sp. C21-152]|uniref:DUF1761 domain-containing protein n=1 Tax=Psychromarinibacter sediminicola TaxID=3033385 RepID=A0AAE3T9L5_9RHOB|nr:DUF1761 domain-containing protein [Psychromarinibacter sediminicola]MDF0602347.1 DUF1761 domain-containing protein [Psychromarinibacter sediminicola]